MLKKLVQLAAGQAETMAAIVKQSIKRRWKGFHALKAQSRPSGEKLLKLEEKEQRDVDDMIYVDEWRESER